MQNARVSISERKLKIGFSQLAGNANRFVFLVTFLPNFLEPECFFKNLFALKTRVIIAFLKSPLLSRRVIGFRDGAQDNHNLLKVTFFLVLVLCTNSGFKLKSRC